MEAQLFKIIEKNTWTKGEQPYVDSKNAAKALTLHVKTFIEWLRNNCYTFHYNGIEYWEYNDSRYSDDEIYEVWLDLLGIDN